MNKILEIKFGSHLYGTDTPNSDLDFKGIYIPTAKEIVLGTYKKTIATTRPKQIHERNTKDDVDIEIFSLDRFLELLVQGQTVALDMLFTPRYMYVNSSEQGIQLIDEIFNNRFELLNKNVNAFVGYAKQQAAKYGQKGFRVHGLRSTLEWLSIFPSETLTLTDLGKDLIEAWIKDNGNEHIKIVQIKAPNGKIEDHLQVCDKKYPFHASLKYVKAQLQRKFDEYGKRALQAESNQNIDWKALSHAMRVNNEAKELLETGFITFPRPDKDLLLDIKLGKLDYKIVANLIEEGLENLTKSAHKSTLRESPDKEWANDFVYRIYKEIVKNG